MYICKYLSEKKYAYTLNVCYNRIHKYINTLVCGCVWLNEYVCNCGMCGWTIKLIFYFNKTWAVFMKFISFAKGRIWKWLHTCVYVYVCIYIHTYVYLYILSPIYALKCINICDCSFRICSLRLVDTLMYSASTLRVSIVPYSAALTLTIYGSTTSMLKVRLQKSLW